ncbi:MAG: ribbon-helix-helix domain-containing protein [Rhizomicrobium sp.]
MNRKYEVRRTFRLPKVLLDDLHTAAKERAIPQSEIIREAVHSWIGQTPHKSIDVLGHLWNT